MERNKIILIIIFILLMCKNVKAYDLNENDKIMLQKIAIAEAGNQTEIGIANVMFVVLNRVKDEKFPNSIENVIKQENQFSAYSNGMYEKAIPNEISESAIFLLEKIENKNCLYFENPGGKENTWHSRNLEFVFEFKDHKFYK